MIDILLILRGFSELVKTFTNYLRQMCHVELTGRFSGVNTGYDRIASRLAGTTKTGAKPVGFAPAWR